MSRPLWKGPYFDHNLKLQVPMLSGAGDTTEPTSTKNNIKPIKTMSRSSMIVPAFVNCEFEIHNGKTWTFFKAGAGHIGFKLGDFSSTKLIAVFKKKSKQKRKKK